MENNLVVSQKVSHRITIRPSNCSPTYIFERIEKWHLNKYMNTYVHSSTGHDNLKVKIAQRSINRRDKQQWYIHAMEYYPAIKISTHPPKQNNKYILKRNGVLNHVTTWMTLENTALSERREKQ